MVEEGLFAQFPCERVYGMHNMPGIPLGEFAVVEGPVMAAGDTFEIRVQGRGSHAAMPDQGIDPVVVGSGIVIALPTIASPNIKPQDALGVSGTTFPPRRACHL